MGTVASEKRTVELMIRYYCRRREGNRELCDGCRQLLEYAHARLDRCPYGDGKGACKRCVTHCYRPAMRERVRQVMRYSGPRMLLFAPWQAVRHYLLKTSSSR